MGDANSQGAGVGFDISELVKTVENIQTKLRPALAVWRFLAYIARWESTVVSFLSLCILQVFCWWPGYFPILFGVGFLGVFLHGFYTKSKKGVVNSSLHNYTNARRVVDNEDDHILCDQSSEIKLRSEYLGKYRLWLRVCQVHSEQILSYLQAAYSIMRWESTTKSFRWMVRGGLIFLVMVIMPLHWILTLSLWFVVSFNLNFVGALKRQRNRFRWWRQKRKRKLWKDEAHEEKDTPKQEEIVLERERAASMPENSDPQGFTDSTVDGKSFSEDEDFFEDDTSAAAVPRRGNVVSRWKEMRQRRNIKKQTHCAKCTISLSSILRKRHYCRNCGQDFCSNCCSDEVPRSMLGATAPEAKVEKVRICRDCYSRVMQ